MIKKALKKQVGHEKIHVVKSINLDVRNNIATAVICSFKDEDIELSKATSIFNLIYPYDKDNHDIKRLTEPIYSVQKTITDETKPMVIGGETLYKKDERGNHVKDAEGNKIPLMSHIKTIKQEKVDINPLTGAEIINL